ncbi:hypothetical protein HNP16_001248 [Aeromonas hydrophila]|nr:hypothetical protein [Aeromonas hydrophila]
MQMTIVGKFLLHICYLSQSRDMHNYIRFF